jgi:hypothetical protein
MLSDLATGEMDLRYLMRGIEGGTREGCEQALEGHAGGYVRRVSTEASMKTR